jgi:restriction endonuclease S subunit
MTIYPKNWKVESLDSLINREIIKLNRGDIISKRDIAACPGDYPIYSSANDNDGIFGRYGKYMFDEEVITWSIDGGGRFFYRQKQKFSVTNVGGILRIIDQNVLSYKFLYYALTNLHSQIFFDWSRKAHPSVIRLVYDKIPIPPIEDQHKIVDALEKHLSGLNNALENVKQSKLKAAQLRRSILQSAFTGSLGNGGTDDVNAQKVNWKIKRLGDCLQKLGSGKLVERGWSPLCLTHPAKNDDTWGVLKTTSVQMGEFQPQYNKELPNSLKPKIGLEVNAGDFLMTTTGPRNRCGVICYVKSTPKKLIFSGKILRFRVNQNIIRENWLMYLIMSPDYQSKLDKLKVGSSDSSVSIGNNQVLDLEIPVPPIEEQLNIVDFLENQIYRLNVTEDLAESLDKQSSGLRRSIIQAAVTGQITKGEVSV